MTSEGASVLLKLISFALFWAGTRGTLMPIGNVVERGNLVYVYDENGHQLCSIISGHGPDDGLVGYTSSTVNIRRGKYIYTKGP